VQYANFSRKGSLSFKEFVLCLCLGSVLQLFPLLKAYTGITIPLPGERGDAEATTVRAGTSRGETGRGMTGRGMTGRTGSGAQPATPSGTRAGGGGGGTGTATGAGRSPAGTPSGSIGADAGKRPFPGASGSMISIDDRDTGHAAAGSAGAAPAASAATAPVAAPGLAVASGSGGVTSGVDARATTATPAVVGEGGELEGTKLYAQGMRLVRALRIILEAYVLFDRDGSGTIDRTEVLAMIEDESRKQTNSSGRRKESSGNVLLSKERWMELDVDDSGEISFAEFVHAFLDWVGIEDDDEDDGTSDAGTARGTARPTAASHPALSPATSLALGSEAGGAAGGTAAPSDEGHGASVAGGGMTSRLMSDAELDAQLQLPLGPSAPRRHSSSATSAREGGDGAAVAAAASAAAAAAAVASHSGGEPSGHGATHAHGHGHGHGHGQPHRDGREGSAGRVRPTGTAGGSPASVGGTGGLRSSMRVVSTGAVPSAAGVGNDRGREGGPSGGMRSAVSMRLPNGGSAGGGPASGRSNLTKAASFAGSTTSPTASMSSTPPSGVVATTASTRVMPMVVAALEPEVSSAVREAPSHDVASGSGLLGAPTVTAADVTAAVPAPHDGGESVTALATPHGGGVDPVVAALVGSGAAVTPRVSTPPPAATTPMDADSPRARASGTAILPSPTQDPKPPVADDDHDHTPTVGTSGRGLAGLSDGDGGEVISIDGVRPEASAEALVRPDGETDQGDAAVTRAHGSGGVDIVDGGGGGGGEGGAVSGDPMLPGQPDGV